ncbi:hypothetical protein GJ496_004871 [Pomphorhynchus laevis]|nr:hypothetical protein GJ496_004871 [Pomphorhynchus laevis]
MISPFFADILAVSFAFFESFDSSDTRLLFHMINNMVASVLVNGTDCSDIRNQTNFSEVDNGLNDVRTSDEKVTDLPGKDEEKPTTIYL